MKIKNLELASLDTLTTKGSVNITCRGEERQACLPKGPMSREMYLQLNVWLEKIDYPLQSSHLSVFFTFSLVMSLSCPCEICMSHCETYMSAMQMRRNELLMLRVIHSSTGFRYGIFPLWQLGDIILWCYILWLTQSAALYWSIEA